MSKKEPREVGFGHISAALTHALIPLFYLKTAHSCEKNTAKSKLKMFIILNY